MISGPCSVSVGLDGIVDESENCAAVDGSLWLYKLGVGDYKAQLVSRKTHKHGTEHHIILS